MEGGIVITAPSSRGSEISATLWAPLLIATTFIQNTENRLNAKGRPRAHDQYNQDFDQSAMSV